MLPLKALFFILTVLKISRFILHNVRLILRAVFFHVYSILQYITVHYGTLQYITVHYSTLRYITVHYSTLEYIRYITVHYSTLEYITVH